MTHNRMENRPITKPLWFSFCLAFFSITRAVEGPLYCVAAPAGLKVMDSYRFLPLSLPLPLPCSCALEVVWLVASGFISGGSPL